MPFLKLVVRGGSGLTQGASYFQHWLQSDNGTLADPADLAVALMSRISTHLLPELSAFWNCAAVAWQWFGDTQTPGLPEQVEAITPVVGEQDAGDPMPPRVTMMIQYRSLAVGLNRKRVFVGRFMEGQNDGTGSPNGNVLSAVIGYGNATMGSMSVNGRDWQFGVCRLNPSTNIVSAFQPFQSFQVSDKWAYLRSRDPGRGI